MSTCRTVARGVGRSVRTGLSDACPGEDDVVAVETLDAVLEPEERLRDEGEEGQRLLEADAVR